MYGRGVVLHRVVRLVRELECDVPCHAQDAGKRSCRLDGNGLSHPPRCDALSTSVTQDGCPRRWQGELSVLTGSMRAWWCPRDLWR